MGSARAGWVPPPGEAFLGWSARKLGPLVLLARKRPGITQAVY